MNLCTYWEMMIAMKMKKDVNANADANTNAKPEVYLCIYVVKHIHTVVVECRSSGTEEINPWKTIHVFRAE